MKKCFKCGEIKLLTEFYKNKAMKDGHLNKCKSCAKLDVQKNYQKNIDYYHEYDQIRNQERKQEIKERNAKWQKANPERVRQLKQNWSEKNQFKRKAHNAINNAIRDGKLIRGKCQICGSFDTHAHHYNYSKPFNIIWLCDHHHKRIHWWLKWNKRKYK